MPTIKHDSYIKPESFSMTMKLSASVIQKIYQRFYFQASERAKLGMKAARLLKRGRPVDDQLTVDIIIEAIK